MNDREKFIEINALTKRIRPMLAGVDPDIVGPVLGDLLAIFFAGHNPEVRAETQLAFRKMVDGLVELYDASGPWPKPERRDN